MGGRGSLAPSAPTASILSMEADLACLWSNPSALSVSQLVVRRKGRTVAGAAPRAGDISLLRMPRMGREIPSFPCILKWADAASIMLSSSKICWEETTAAKAHASSISATVKVSSWKVSLRFPFSSRSVPCFAGISLGKRQQQNLDPEGSTHQA